MTGRLRKVNWQVVTVAVALLAVVVLYGRELSARQETYRKAFCDILKNIQGDVPPSIATARRSFARDGHPRDCQPVVRRRPSTPPKPARTPAPTPTVVVVPVPGATRTVSPSPAPAVTVTRTATPRPSRTPSSRPTPSPSKTCVLFVCKE